MQNKNIMEVRNLSFIYPDGTLALKDINLDIRRGEFLGVLGANGSGKTTLLRLLNGLLKAASGNISFEQEDMRLLDRDRLFSKVCTCFQNPDHQLFSATAAQDIAFGPINLGLNRDEVDKRVEDALRSVGMLEFADKTISSLSYGQKKRICLAGVLAMGPEVILLDEPTACLDPLGVNSIMHLLLELNKEKGVTMVMSTHSVDLVPIFIDRVIVLNRGNIVNQGLPQTVFSDSLRVESAGLRLPRIGQLFEALKNEDGLDIQGLPLTVGEARDELNGLLNLWKL